MARRNQAQRLEDRTIIGKMYLRGYSQKEIVDYLNTRADRTYTIVRQTVRTDLEHILAEWKASGLRDIDALIAEELARINQLERTYWEAYQKSCEVRTKTTIRKEPERDLSYVNKKGELKTMKNPGGTIATQTKDQTPEGDPRFLAGVEHCIAMRVRLLRLDQVERIEGELTEETRTVIVLPEKDWTPE